MNYQPNPYSQQPERRLYRSDDSVIFGVCGGIAEYFDLPPWGVRLVWVLLTLIAFPFMLIGYIVLALVVKRRPRSAAPPPFRGAAPAATPAPGFENCRLSHAEMLRRVQQRFETLDKRLQRMESIVTSPGFKLDREWRNL